MIDPARGRALERTAEESPDVRHSARMGLLLEGVDEGKPGGRGEVADVAGGEFVAAGHADARDLGVGQGHGPTGCLGGYQDGGGFSGCREVIDRDGVGEGVHQGAPAGLEVTSTPPRCNCILNFACTVMKIQLLRSK